MTYHWLLYVNLQVLFPYSAVVVSNDGSYFALLDKSCSFKIYRGDASDYIIYLTYILNRDMPYRHRASNEDHVELPAVLQVFETPAQSAAINGQCFAGLDDVGVFHVFRGHPSNPNSYPLWSSMDYHYATRDDYIQHAFHKDFLAIIVDGALVIYSQPRRRGAVDADGPTCEWSSAETCSDLLSTARHLSLELNYQLYKRSRPLRESLVRATSTLSHMVRQLFYGIDRFMEVCMRLLQILTTY